MELFPPTSSDSPARGASSRQESQATSSHHSLSTLAGHILSARDRRSPVGNARLQVDMLEVRSRGAGQYDLPLDTLPVRLEVRITADGFQPYVERLDWSSVATGGLLVRNFHLIPVDMAAPQQSRSASQPASLQVPAVREAELEDDELELEDDLELEMESEEEFWEEEEPDGWEDDGEGEDPFEALSAAWDGKDDLDAEIELSMDPVPGPPRVVRRSDR